MDQFYDGIDLQFAHDRGPMSFNRLDADRKTVGDLFVAFAFGKHLHDLALAAGQSVKRRSFIDSCV